MMRASQSASDGVVSPAEVERSLTQLEASLERIHARLFAANAQQRAHHAKRASEDA